MKKTVIFGSLLASTLTIHSQQWGGSANQTNSIYRTGSVRVGTSSGPATGTTFHVGSGIGTLHYTSAGDGSMQIKGSTGDRAILELEDPSSTNRTIFQSLSYATFLNAGVNNGVPIPLYLQGNGGNTGINNTSPSYMLDLKTSSANDGMSITQTSGQSAALHMFNNSSGGRHWALFSTGAGNTQGSGHFSIYDYNAGSDRLFISGSTGNIGINRTAPINARLDVKQDLNEYTFNRAIYGDAVSTSQATYWNGGVEGVAGTGGCSNSENYGVRGRALGGNNGNFGGYFHAENYSCNTGNAYGIYADAVAGGGGAYAAFLPGTVYAYSYTGPSDQKLKENIKPLVNTMNQIKALKPSTYNYKTNDFRDMNLPEGSQMGLIAQELEKVFPELITEVKEIIIKNEKGDIVKKTPDHKSVNYIGLIPILISGIQEQQSIVEALQQQIVELKQTLSSQGTATGISQISNATGSFNMDQNTPNPFTNETLIKYTLSEQTKIAVLNVYDLSGKQIASFPIPEKGSSSITITSEKLAAGIYIYSIVADGKIMDSKRMVVAEK